MPEGPQVRRTGQLIVSFIGQPITKLTIIPKNKVLPLPSPFTITTVEVKGKNIFIYLNNGQVLYNHMLMWGKWSLGCEKMLGNKHLNTCFATPNGELGYYGGGVLKVISKEEAAILKNKLGPDIITETKYKKTFNLLRESPLPIGEALLAQELVSGIGNIYKSEGLFMAQLNPNKPANKLTDAEAEKLFTILHKQMVKDVTDPGIITTPPELLKKGYRRFVYKRYHQPCLICQTKIERMYQGKNLVRSTYFCPNCQNVT